MDPDLRERMEGYRATVVAYLKRVREESGLSLHDIARRVGVSHTTLTRAANNPNYKYVPKIITLQRIAALTRIELPEALTTPAADVGRHVATMHKLGSLRVRGMVAAGIWQSTESISGEDYGVIPIVADPTYAGMPQWAELVRGPAMNRVFQDGDYVIVVDFGADYHPRPGERVICERQRGNGDVERSCRRIVRDDEGLSLAGESTDPRWNDLVPLGKGQLGEKYAIIGVVIGLYRPLIGRA